LKALLINIVLILALTTFLPRNTAIIRDSKGAHALMRFSAYLIEVTPKEMKNSFESKVKELHKSWKHH